MIPNIRITTKDDPLIAQYNKLPGFNATTRVWICSWDVEVAVILGLIPGSLLSNRGFLWSITTPEAELYRKSFLKYSRILLREILDEYPILVGFCDQKTKWLKHLGAEFNGDTFMIRK